MVSFDVMDLGDASGVSGSSPLGWMSSTVSGAANAFASGLSSGDVLSNDYSDDMILSGGEYSMQAIIDMASNMFDSAGIPLDGAIGQLLLLALGGFALYFVVIRFFGLHRLFLRLALCVARYNLIIAHVTYQLLHALAVNSNVAKRNANAPPPPYQDVLDGDKGGNTVVDSSQQRPSMFRRLLFWRRYPSDGSSVTSQS